MKVRCFTLIALFLFTSLFAQGDAKLIEKAKSSNNAGKFKDSQNIIKKLIKEYPKSQKLDEAHLIMGESYYKESKYQLAIKEYSKVVSIYKSKHVPEALFKLSDSYDKANYPEKAVITLWKLINFYPNSSFKDLAKKRINEISRR